MQQIDAMQVRDSVFSWALWKVLDFLTGRYLKPYVGALAGDKDNAGVATAVAPEALVAASQQLADPASPVLTALTAIWAQRGTDDEAGLAALTGQLAHLAPAEGLVVLAVIAQALKVG
jgi:hypothetical protein